MIKRNRKLAVLGQHMMEDYKHVDTIIDTSLSTAKHSCKIGCAACCKQLVQLSPPEAAAIALKYPAVLAAKRSQISAQDKHLRSLLTQIFGTSASIAIEVSEYRQKIEQIADLWWEEQRDCVFLTNDNTCSVYEARPLACRAYYVRSDPARCFGVKKNKVEVFQFGVVAAVQAHLIAHTGQLRISYLPLVLAAVQ